MILILSVGVVVIALGIGYLLFQNLNSEEAAAPAPTTQALSTQEPAPAPPADAVGSLDGSIWVGTMKNGKYSFRMKLSESAGGGLTASMYQKNTANGDDGDQALTGSRQGTEVNLQGTSWSGAPAGWTTDTIKFTVTGGGVRSMNGQYTCANCSGWSDITGDMVP